MRTQIRKGLVRQLQLLGILLDFDCKYFFMGPGDVMGNFDKPPIIIRVWRIRQGMRQIPNASEKPLIQGKTDGEHQEKPTSTALGLTEALKKVRLDLRRQTKPIRQYFDTGYETNTERKRKAFDSG
ncbi:hypothetical protein BS47DRAFT_1362775 [Hydnum rufescens UP504]|uniref:Uncharacterized protein n=1 Tax=Hydnum rufescens UP504 TaxID=1448309 RepID=A0A9P6DVT0_9AGAM|nr:hypothetical protein BS47DRAFT_1362775 [Hydnum rufescens UP504]